MKKTLPCFYHLYFVITRLQFQLLKHYQAYWGLELWTDLWCWICKSYASESLDLMVSFVSKIHVKSIYWSIKGIFYSPTKLLFSITIQTPIMYIQYCFIYLKWNHVNLWMKVQLFKNYVVTGSVTIIFNYPQTTCLWFYFLYSKYSNEFHFKFHKIRFSCFHQKFKWK